MVSLTRLLLLVPLGVAVGGCFNPGSTELGLGSSTGSGDGEGQSGPATLGPDSTFETSSSAGSVGTDPASWTAETQDSSLAEAEGSTDISTGGDTAATEGTVEVCVPALEICDGADGDCDGTPDLEEGFRLSGTVESFSDDQTFVASAAWSDAAQAFGVYYITSATGRTTERFMRVSADGVLLGDTAVGVRNRTASVLAANGSGFGLAAYDDLSSAFMFQRYTNAGLLDGNAVDLQVPNGAPTASALVSVQDGWIVAWSDSDTDQVLARGLTAENELVADSPTVVGAANARGGVSIVMGNDEVVIAFVAGDQVFARRYALDLAPLGDSMLVATTAGSARDPSLVAFDDGYALIWGDDQSLNGNRIFIARVDRDGNELCREEVTQRPTITGGTGIAALALHADGFLVTYVDDLFGQERAALMAEVDAACQPRTVRHVMENDLNYQKDDFRLYGTGPYLATWRLSSASLVVRRHFRASLCE